MPYADSIDADQKLRLIIADISDEQTYLERHFPSMPPIPVCSTPHSLHMSTTVDYNAACVTIVLIATGPVFTKL